MKKQHVFPLAADSFSRGMAASDILLDGMKVLFDKKSTLLPVELEKIPAKKITTPNNKDNGKAT